MFKNEIIIGVFSSYFKNRRGNWFKKTQKIHISLFFIKVDLVNIIK